MISVFIAQNKNENMFLIVLKSFYLFFFFLKGHFYLFLQFTNHRLDIVVIDLGHKWNEREKGPQISKEIKYWPLQCLLVNSRRTTDKPGPQGKNGKFI